MYRVANILRFGVLFFGIVGLMVLSVPAVAAPLTDAVVQPPCNEAALNTALSVVHTFGGTVTFNCGSDPVTILLSQQKTIGNDVQIDGGGTITLSGGDSTRLFNIWGGGALTIKGLTLTHGVSFSDHGGAVYVNSGASFTAEHSAFTRNGTVDGYGSAIFTLPGAIVVLDHVIVAANATWGGGAVSSSGSLSITDSVFRDNWSNLGGGALSLGGVTTVTNSQFLSNSGGAFAPVGDSYGGGAILLVAGATLTVTGGRFEGNNTQTWGGAIDSLGNLTVRDVTFRANGSGRAGGAISARGGQLTADHVVATNNTAIDNGGAFAIVGVPTYVNDSSFYANSVVPLGLESESFGGAISYQGSYLALKAVDIRGSTFSGNYAGYGSALSIADSNFLMINSTVSGNTAGVYGAIQLYRGQNALISDTIANNSATTGSVGGLVQEVYPTILYASLIANNSPANCGVRYGGTINSGGSNLFGDLSCATANAPAAPDQHNIDPLLGPIADNGGPTLTHMPAANSPAVDRGLCFFITADQRGAHRPAGAACDVGAVEAGSQPPVPTAVALRTLAATGQTPARVAWVAAVALVVAMLVQRRKRPAELS